MSDLPENAKVVLLGLDGATFRVLEPLCKLGVMPATARLLSAGTKATLKSTVPTYTPPAWVSMATGVNPGRHGIFGFLSGTPQDPVDIVHSGLIDAPPLWRYLNEAGISTGVFNIPMYYPPEDVDGFMVAGGLAAGWTDARMPNFSTDERTREIVGRAVGSDYPLDTVVSYEKDWNSTDVIRRITGIQRIRRRALTALLESTEVQVLFTVFEGVDRLQHLIYQYIVDCSKWFSADRAPRFRELAHEYFQELDAAVGDLVSWAGDDGYVLLVSDHGFGSWEKTLNINLLLEEWGFLELPAVSRMTRLKSVAGAGQTLARKVVPRPMLHKLKARIGATIPWQHAKAFASHVAEQGIHINTRGAFPQGAVDVGSVPHIERELVDRLMEFVDPTDGLPVVDRVVPRNEVIEGPHFARSPHLFPFCRDQRYELSDTIAASGPLTDHLDRPWGYHHSDGVLVATGPDVIPSSTLDATVEIVDVLPTVFHLLRLPIPDHLDGEVRRDLMRDPAAERPVDVSHQRPSHETTRDSPYSDQEEAAIEESLRGLGYLE